jgi:hypothetical protein
VLVDVLCRSPELLAEPVPPLGPWLRKGRLEAFGGQVGFAGTPWSRMFVRGLDRPAVVAGTLALGTLLAWDESDTEHRRELLDRLTRHEGGLVYLADEIERRTANEGASFSPALDWLAAAASTGAERAAVALCSARAAEGTGDSATAQRLVIAALAEQPGLKPALMDAGEYAACRGDLTAAGDHLRHVDHPVAENLRTAIRSTLGKPAAAQTGRNRPCPCGSGRKAKLCCAAFVVPPLAARAELLYALIATFTQRAPACERLGTLVARSTGHPQHPLVCIDLLLTHEGYLRRFLHARGAWLRDDERALLEEWAGIPIGAFEVRQVRRGQDVTIRRLPGGEKVVLNDRLFSTSTHRLDLFCGRILTDGTGPRAFAIPAFVSRDRRRDLLALLASDPSADQIAAFLGPQPDPCVINDDGHEYFDAEVTVEVTDDEAAWQRLGTELTPADWNLLDHQVERDGRTISLGTVTRHGRRWKLWANSRERLAALEERVRTVTGPAREVDRRATRIGGEPPADGTTVRTIVISSQIMGADPQLSEERARADLLRATSQSWVDTTVDALGRTPREAAAAGGTARAELAALLDDMEWRSNYLQARGESITMDVEWIRRELDLPYQAFGPGVEDMPGTG